MAERIGKIIVDEVKIRKRLSDLVKKIARDCNDNEPVIVAILKGSFMFLADLVRLLYIHDIHAIIDFMIVSSYVGTESSGIIEIQKDITTPIEGRWVIVVDDILDTGRTMSNVVRCLEEKGPRSIKTCVLLDKPSRRLVDIEADYCGFTIDNHFVIGYGLDYNNRYRDLPFIGILDVDEEIEEA